MTCKVWITDAMTDTALTRHFSPTNDYFSHHSAVGKMKNKLYSGDLVDRAELPSEKLVLTRKVGPIDPLPHFMTNAYVFISKQLKEVLCQFELGRTAFYPVTLYGMRAEKVLGPEYFYLNVAERKGAFDAGASKVETSPFSGSHSADLLSERTDVVVTSAACHGVDLWMEADLRGTMFLSDRLMRAVSDSGLLHDVRFQECTVI